MAVNAIQPQQAEIEQNAPLQPTRRAESHAPKSQTAEHQANAAALAGTQHKAVQSENHSGQEQGNKQGKSQSGQHVNVYA